MLDTPEKNAGVDALKTVLVDALNAAEQHPHDDEFFYTGKSKAGEFIFSVDHVTLDADRLATTVLAWATIHFLDREKVRSVTAATMIEFGSIDVDSTNDQMLDFMVDRLIEGLAK